MSSAASKASKARMIGIGIVVAALTWLPGPDGTASLAAGDPLAERRLERAAPDTDREADPAGEASVAGEPGFGGGSGGGSGGGGRPDGWPDDVAVPDAVRAADDRLAAARDALRRTRRGLDAEVSLAPTLDLLARDDPPRPLEAELAWRPKASLSWSPLRSEALLAEARVLEAEADRIAAWREATLSALRAPVILARAHDAVAAAERDLEAARRQQADVESEAEALAAEMGAATTDAWAGQGTTQERERAAPLRRRAAATLDVREARIELDEARRELHDLRPGSEDLQLDLPTERRPDLTLPALPEATATRAYRARALRLAAGVARSERRWRKAVMPRLGVEVGYAGSDGSVAAELELRDGRPRGRVSGALGGTPQERGWATVSALFRLGTDLPSAESEKVAAREEERQALRHLAAAWTREAVDRWQDAHTARARWQVAEARRATIAPDDERGHARALEAARRSWLRYLAALDKVTSLAESWPELAP